MRQKIKKKGKLVARRAALLVESVIVESDTRKV